MANYVWNRVICRKEILDQYFIDTDPFGDGTPVERPYISFNKLFGVNLILQSLKRAASRSGFHIGFLRRKRYNPDDSQYLASVRRPCSFSFVFEGRQAIGLIDEGE